MRNDGSSGGAKRAKKKTKRELDKLERELLKPAPITIDRHEIEVFILGECNRGIFRTLLTTYREYLLLREAWRKKIEFERLQTRDICFYTLAPHRGKNSQIHKPSDLYPVTREEIERYYQDRAPVKRTRREIKLQQAFFKQLDAK